MRIQLARFTVAFSCTVLAILFSLSPQTAQAASSQTVLINLPQVGFTGSYNSNYFDSGVVFSVPAGSNWTLDSVGVQLIGTNATYQAYLYEVTGPLPGTLISQIGGTAPVNTTGAGEVVTFVPNTAITLQANHTYHLLLNGTGAYGLTLNLPTGVFTFQYGTLIDKSTSTPATLNSSSIPISIDATPQLAPTASFTTSPVDRTITFTDTSTEAPTAWAWDFGDGSPVSTQQNPTHQYAADGIYNVCLTASNTYGSSSPACQNINVTNTVPTVTINQSGGQADPTNTSPILFDVQFSEAVTGFDNGDINVSGTAGGTFGISVSGGPSSYTVQISGVTTPGTVIASIPANAAQDNDGGGSSASTSTDNSVTFAPGGTVPIIRYVLNDGTDVSLTVPNPNPSFTPTFSITSGAASGLTIDAVTGDLVYALDPGAAVGTRNINVHIDTSDGQSFDQLVQIIVQDMLPPPPPIPLCDTHNFDEGGIVRASAPDAIAYAINCRVLYQNGEPTRWIGGDLYSEGNLGLPGLLDLGVIQAVDIFSPPGLTYFEGGAVFCLRSQGTLIWLAASGVPRHAEIIGSYTVPEFPGFTCATLFEPGTLILVSHNPAS